MQDQPLSKRLSHLRRVLLECKMIAPDEAADLSAAIRVVESHEKACNELSAAEETHRVLTWHTKDERK